MRVRQRSFLISSCAHVNICSRSYYMYSHCRAFICSILFCLPHHVKCATRTPIRIVRFSIIWSHHKGCRVNLIARVVESRTLIIYVTENNVTQHCFRRRGGTSNLNALHRSSTPLLVCSFVDRYASRISELNFVCIFAFSL